MSTTQPDPTDASTPEELFILPDGLQFNRDVLDTLLERSIGLTVSLQNPSQSQPLNSALWALEGQLTQLKQYLDKTLPII